MTVVEERMAGISEGLDALERNDLEGFMAIVERNSHPDVEFTSAIGAAFGSTSFRGFEGIRAWFEEFLETMGTPIWGERRFEPLGDEAFLFFAHFTATGAASELPVETEVGQVMELEGGLIKRGRSYASHAEARAAAEALHA